MERGQLTDSLVSAKVSQSASAATILILIMVVVQVLSLKDLVLGGEMPT